MKNTKIELDYQPDKKKLCDLFICWIGKYLGMLLSSAAGGVLELYGSTTTAAASGLNFVLWTGGRSSSVSCTGRSSSESRTGRSSSLSGTWRSGSVPGTGWSSSVRRALWSQTNTPAGYCLSSLVLFNQLQTLSLAIDLGHSLGSVSRIVLNVQIQSIQ